MEKQPERAGGTRELSGARVLLVGFPTAEREPIEEALTGWGAVAVRAASVEDAVARLVSEISVAAPYRAVLVYSDSKELGLVARLRASGADLAPPCVLAVPRTLQVPRFEALSAGFAGVLELPFEKRQLFNVLHSVAAGEETGEGVVRLTDYARRAPDARKIRILVADDNRTNREVISKILDRGGHSVKLVEDGEQMLDALEHEPFDAVILDRNMPGLSGVEALQALRVMERGGERTPVIMLSADATAEAKKEAYEAGADSFLSKPIEALRLLEEVQTVGGSRAAPAVSATAKRASAPATTGPAEPPMINTETLAYLEELGSSATFVKKLCGVFMNDSTALLERVEASVAARNYDEFRAALHALKGCSASIGTERLTRMCARFAKYSNGELRLEGSSVVRTLADELASTRRELDRYLQQRQQSAS
jgi:two-component system sensor histidine kinase RpfC